MYNVASYFTHAKILKMETKRKMSHASEILYHVHRKLSLRKTKDCFHLKEQASGELSLETHSEGIQNAESASKRNKV